MFASRGEATPPCGVPVSVWLTSPSSITPAFSHLRIRRMTRRSPTRCSTKRINHSWLTASKNPAMPARRRRPVGSSMNPGVKIGELALEILAVFLPCHAVYTGRRIPLQPRVGAVKKPGIDMVEERGEPFLPIQPCSCPYTVQSRGHAYPARGPARVGSSRVLLGPLPSLHQLRLRSPDAVRR